MGAGVGVLGGRWKGVGRALGGCGGVGRALEGRWEDVGRALASGEGWARPGSSIFEMPRARGRPRGRGGTEAERREAHRLVMAQRRAAMAAEELERANLERARARAALPNEVRDQINDDNAHHMAGVRAQLTHEE